MDRKRISWLIVRAFGLYLLVQALLLVPETLVGIVAARYYSNMMSAEAGNAGTYSRVATSMYRLMPVGPMLRVVLYLAVGIYMLRGGEFLVGLLDRHPETASDVADSNEAPNKSDESDADV